MRLFVEIQTDKSPDEVLQHKGLQSLMNSLFQDDSVIVDRDIQKDRNWLFCKNCWGEFSTIELGIFLNSFDNELKFFCPICGFTEFTPNTNEMPEDQNYCEPEEVAYDYPYRNNTIIRMPKPGYIKIHEQVVKIVRDPELNWSDYEL